jgi:hypothetical protein
MSDEERVFAKQILDVYHQCFLDRDLDALSRLYVNDGSLIYNHANCDSETLADHLSKVSEFFYSTDPSEVESL